MHAAPAVAWDTPVAPYQILGILSCPIVTLVCRRGWCGDGTGRPARLWAARLEAALGGRRDAELHEAVIANVGLW